MNFHLILHLHCIVYLSHHNKSNYFTYFIYLLKEFPLGLHVCEKRQESSRLPPLNTNEKIQVFRQNENQIRTCLVLFVEKRREIDYAVYDLL